MAAEFDLLSSTDHPGLLGLSTPELLAPCQKALQDLGYKVHSTNSHSEFLSRFAQIQYQIVILEELFDAASSLENKALINLQTMPMNQRRHTVSILIGLSFQTLHPMQAFQQSVHAVVNMADVQKLPQIIQKVVADHDLFYNVLRDTQLRMTQGK